MTMIPSRIADKVGSLGALVSGMSCAMCFPALASVGAAVGLGFLAAWERLFITTLIPLFAVIALLANAFNWYNHRQWFRGLLGILGPVMVLAGVAPFIFGLGQVVAYANFLFYPGLALMLAVAIWDLVRPATRQCDVPGSTERAKA